MNTIRVNIGSLFRDSVNWHGLRINQVDRFFTQIKNQHQENWALGKIVVLEGDSKDNTLEQLEDYGKELGNVDIIQENCKNSVVRSTGKPSRIIELSKIGQKVLDRAKANCDYLFWIESDLIIHENLVGNLLKAFDKFPKLGIIAPVVCLESPSKVFYDTWAFRETNGKHWRNRSPWYPQDNNQYRPMQSIGSCALMRADILVDGVGFNEGAFPNLCTGISKLGYEVVVDTNETIYHPSSRFVAQRWI